MLPAFVRVPAFCKTKGGKQEKTPPESSNYSRSPNVIHLFAGRAVKRERRKGSSRRQQPAYGAAVNEVARELLRSERSPKRENGGRRYIKHDGMIASPVGSCLCCWQLPLSPPVSPLYCSAPHCPPLSLSLSATRFDAFKVATNSRRATAAPRFSASLCGFSLWLVGFPVFRLGDWFT